LETSLEFSSSISPFSSSIGADRCDTGATVGTVERYAEAGSDCEDDGATVGMYDGDDDSTTVGMYDDLRETGMMLLADVEASTVKKNASTGPQYPLVSTACT
jgi:hypothetical protein